MSATEAEKLVTELDVLYGEDIPWYGFTALTPPTTEEHENHVEKVSLTIRKGVQRKSVPVSSRTITELLHAQPCRRRPHCISPRMGDLRLCK
jgi:hypothetical protein